ncbi:MAG: substrate-binding domain-containing protein [Phycisphaerae bacterium]
MATEKHRRIALVVPDIGYDRGILRGVNRYARPTRKWLLHSSLLTTSSVETVRRWKVDGIVVHAQPGKAMDALIALGKPMVNVSGTDVPGVPAVRPDNVAVGRLAAEHLLQRGHRVVAYFGLRRTQFSRARRLGVRQAVRRAGAKLVAFNPFAAVHPDWESYDAAHLRWITGLPKPVGVVCSSDHQGRVLLESLYGSDIRVPREVSVVGVDNDEMHAMMTAPPLSSVELPLGRIGYEAAALLELMMEGEPPPTEPLELPPVGVVTRESSDIVAIRDPEIAAALDYINRNAHRPLTVEDVLGEVAVSRRTLETRFRETLGRTPLAEIRRTHVEQAKKLLSHTDLPMPEIARESGFTSAPALSVIFRRETGMPPTAWRRQYQLR